MARTKTILPVHATMFVDEQDLSAGISIVRRRDDPDPVSIYSEVSLRGSLISQYKLKVTTAVMSFSEAAWIPTAKKPLDSVGYVNSKGQLLEVHCYLASRAFEVIISMAANKRIRYVTLEFPALRYRAADLLSCHVYSEVYRPEDHEILD